MTKGDSKRSGEPMTKKQGEPISPRIEAIITSLSPLWITRNRIAEEMRRPVDKHRKCAVLNPADITALNKLVHAGKVEHRISYSDQSGYNRIVHEYRLKR